MNELISVIINIYNGEKYVDKCLDCVLNQTYKKLEILIVNDGSTDNTLKLLKKYKDKRIRLISTKNMGLSLSRNTGITNAKGKYLFFVDVDDVIDYDLIEYLYKLLKEYKTDISTCETQIISKKDSTKKITPKKIKEKTCLKTDVDMLKKVLLSNNRHGAIWNKLYKRKLFNNCLFEDRIVEDTVIVYKLFIKAKTIAYSNQKKYFYIRNSTGITGSKNPYRAIDQYYVAKERYDYIEKIYPNMIENKIAVLIAIVDSYNHNSPISDEFIEKNNIYKEYKEIFSLRFLFTNLSIKHKIKLILYRINPKIERFFQKKVKGI